MLSQITAALVKEIHAHADTIIGGIIACIGAVLGAVVTFALSLWQQRGKVTVAAMRMQCNPKGKEDKYRGEVGANFEAADYIDYVFELRITNYFPADQSIDVSRVEFFDASPDLHSGRFAFSDASESDYNEWMHAGKRHDIRVPARGFKTTYLRGMIVTTELDRAKQTALFKSIRGVQLDFIVYPNRKITLRHEFKAWEFPGIENQRPPQQLPQ